MASHRCTKIWLDEQSLYNDMHAYTHQVLALSVLISLATAVLVYLALQWLMVRPIIEITDNGRGIPGNLRAHLFQPFVDSAHPSGTGLGLATAHDLVRAHGGDLVLRKTGQEGTCFRITLPEACVTDGRSEQ